MKSRRDRIVFAFVCLISVSIALDTSGNIYGGGKSNTSWGSPIRPFSKGGDAFVAKISESNNIWNTRVIDNQGNTGIYTSLTFNKTDHPGISYFGHNSTPDNSLRFSFFDGSSWLMKEVAILRNGNWTSSLAFDNASIPAIAVIHDPWDAGIVRYYRQGESGWNMDYIDGTSGGYVSLKYDSSGQPTIAYQTATTGGSINAILRLAHFNGTTWDLQTIDDFHAGFCNSLAFDNLGHYGISYLGTSKYDYRTLGNALKYAYYNGTVWTIQTIDAEGNVGWWTSLVFDSSNKPGISYYDNTNGDLKYAHFNGTSWDISVVDSEGNVGEFSSMALDKSGRPCISYYDRTNQRLKFARFDGSIWNKEIVDSTGDVGSYCSLAFDSSGTPAISYYDATNGSLKFATWTTASVDPAISALSPNSGPVGTVVTISGSNFGSIKGTVKINGVAASVTSWSNTEIKSSVPSGATTGPVIVHTSVGKDSNGVTFTVTNTGASITIISPNGGENWQRGSTKDIIWSISGITGDLIVDLYENNSRISNLCTIASTERSFSWEIPPDLPLGNIYKIRIYQGMIEDHSDGYFSISSLPGNKPPVAHFTFSPAEIKSGIEVKLDASQSYDPDGDIQLYEWDFDGDGDFDGFTSVKVIYYFWNESGTYNAKLRVTDKGGATAIYEQTINVKPLSFWEKTKIFFAPSMEILSRSERNSFFTLKSELNIQNYPHSLFEDPDFFWFTDNQLLTVLKKKAFPDACDLTYEARILDTLNDMKLVDSIANRSFFVDPRIEKYFENMAEINVWAKVGMSISKEALIGVIKASGGSGLGIGPILMLPDVFKALAGLNFLDDIFKRRALWYYFQNRQNAEDPVTAFNLSPVPLKYYKQEMNDYFETLWIEYGDANISEYGGLKQLFKDNIIKELRTFLLYGMKKYKFEPIVLFKINSPGDIIVKDFDGRITGYLNKRVFEEIPDSAYDIDSETVIVFSGNEKLLCQVKGTNEGSYGLKAISIENGKATNFNASEIPISTKSIHEYSINWDAIEKKEEGVLLKVDYNGDGIYDYYINTGTTLDKPETWALNISTTSGGMTEPSIGDHLTFARSYFPIRAVAEKGYLFKEWIGDILSSQKNENPFNLYMNSSKKITAIFQLIPYSIQLSKSRLSFGAVIGGVATSYQNVIINDSESGKINWTANVQDAWINISYNSGVGTKIVQVSVNPANLSVGSHNGTITISDPNATNSPQTITVTLTVKEVGTSAVPLGDFATPLDGTTGITGAVPVTGWVLDDIETTKVEIKRDPVTGDPPAAIGPDGLVYIGDAIFVEGARPDVEAAYPAYPLNYRAGWGYMMLTNFLPNQGNGTFKIHAYAYDKEGNKALLGTKTITCSNATAVKPFGTIDTPAQGGDVSGNTYVNFGWVLAPQPNLVPKDGSTITAWVDGVQVGVLKDAPNAYNQYRADIAGLFPGLKNSDGPVGFAYLDTTKYSNAVHTIYWIATDDAGHADGIGSRYFNIMNTGTSPSQTDQALQAIALNGSVSYDSLMNLPVSFEPRKVKRGFDLIAEPEAIQPDEYGVVHIIIGEVERVELDLKPLPGEITTAFGAAEYSGFLVVGNRLRPLPIGSTLDQRRGAFSWLPGPGFLGQYEFLFMRINQAGVQTRINVNIRIIPKFGLNEDGSLIQTHRIRELASPGKEEESIKDELIPGPSGRQKPSHSRCP